MRTLFLGIVLASSSVALTACDKGGERAPSSPTSSAPSPSAERPAALASNGYDLQFIDSMTEHHRSAVQMGKMASTKASHEELRAMGQKVVDAQDREIAQMKTWRDQWFTNAPVAVDHSMPGMKQSMGMDMSKLMQSSGAEFDHEYIDMMTKHHEAGIAMAKDALEKSKRDEVKGLAQKIIEDQSKENEMMKGLAAQWFAGHSHDSETPRGR